MQVATSCQVFEYQYHFEWPHFKCNFSFEFFGFEMYSVYANCYSMMDVQFNFPGFSEWEILILFDLYL